MRDEPAPRSLDGPAVGASVVLLLAAALATLAVFVSGARISRAEGALFVTAYVGYVTWLIVVRA